MVRVYAARVKNPATATMESAQHKGTASWITLIKGEKIEGTAEDVDASLVDTNGRYNPKGE